MSASPPATRLPPASRGDRSVAIDAPTSNTVIITGDRNTVRMELGGPGALLAFLFRWDRPRARRRRDVPCPPGFADHVDRVDEVAAIVGEGDGEPRVVNVYGDRGIGKTHVLLAALNQPDARARHGRAYVGARDLDAEDVLHAVFDAFFTVRTPRRDLHIDDRLRTRRAVVAIDDLALDHGAVQRLLLALPRARVLIASASRSVLDGRPVPLHGLPAEHAPAIAVQELGHPLSDEERIAAESIADTVDGHPVRLRQVFGVARDERRPLADVAMQASRLVGADARLAAMSDAERAVARALMVFGGATVGVEHLQALAGPRASDAAVALEMRHDAVPGSPRYRLVGALRSAEPPVAELDRALAHFVPWAAEHAGDHAAILAERHALLALLDRAADAGRRPDVLRLGRAIEASLAWGRCWAAWGRVLEHVLHAARAENDTAAAAWALHQLGTRAYGRGDAHEARELLEQAADLRREIGDERGLAATRQNLRVVTGRPTWLQRLSHASATVLTALVVLLVGVGAFGGAALGDGRLPVVDTEVPFIEAAETDAQESPGSEESEAAPGTTTDATPIATTDARTTTTTITTAPPARVVLQVQMTGRGRVVSEPTGIDCGATCTADFAEGEDVTLVATPSPRFEVAGWSQASCETNTVCTVTLGRAATVTVEFAVRKPGGPPTTPTEPPPAPTDPPTPPLPTIPDENVPAETGPVLR